MPSIDFKKQCWNLQNNSRFSTAVISDSTLWLFHRTLTAHHTKKIRQATNRVRWSCLQGCMARQIVNSLPHQNRQLLARSCDLGSSRALLQSSLKFTRKLLSSRVLGCSHHCTKGYSFQTFLAHLFIDPHRSIIAYRVPCMLTSI